MKLIPWFKISSLAERFYSSCIQFLLLLLYIMIMLLAGRLFHKFARDLSGKELLKNLLKFLVYTKKIVYKLQFVFLVIN